MRIIVQHLHSAHFLYLRGGSISEFQWEIKASSEALRSRHSSAQVTICLQLPSMQEQRQRCSDLKSKTSRLLSTLRFYLVGEDGFEPSKSKTTDLQSAPFGRSGTRPYGAGDGTRTRDLLITNQLLYQLSYTSIWWE